MTKLLQLSTELLVLIAEHLPQVDLLNVSLSCTQLHSAIKAQLFREYINVQLKGRSFETFIKRILDDPTISNYVHVVRLRVWDTLECLSPGWCTWDNRRARLIPEDKYEFYTEVAKSSGLISVIHPYIRAASYLSRLEKYESTVHDPMGENWGRLALMADRLSFDELFCVVLVFNIDDAFVALLLSMLPNLREIYLDGAQADPNSLPWSSPLLRFPKLTKLSASATDGMVDFPLAFFERQIESPSLDILTMLSTSGWWRGSLYGTGDALYAPLSLPNKALNISRIELQYCSLPRSTMEILLNACCALRSFWYSVGGAAVGPENFTANEIADMLSTNKETLELLYLDILSDWDYDQEPEGIKSLAHLESLRELNIMGGCLNDMLQYESILELQGYNDLHPPNHTIPGEDMLCNRLPRSLEQLIIEDLEGMGELSLPQLRGLFAVRKERFQRLELVTIVSDMHDRYASLEEAPLPGSSIFRSRIITAIDHIFEYSVPFLASNGRYRSTYPEIRWSVEERKYASFKPPSRRRGGDRPAREGSDTSEGSTPRSEYETMLAIY